MDTDAELKKRIIDTLESKSLVKAGIYQTTYDIFQELKNSLHELTGEINEELDNVRLVKTEYRDKGKFEAQLQVADDIILFNMHTNVFSFDPLHGIWKNEYACSGEYNAYVGVINVYNFLNDSFRYNRSEDEGYLIARIFINKDKMFFVEGKGVHGYDVDNFGKEQMTEQKMVEIIEKLMLFVLDFDLYVPPYEDVVRIDLEQVNTKIESSRIETGKRLGFELDLEDIN